MTTFPNLLLGEWDLMLMFVSVGSSLSARKLPMKMKIML